MQSNLPSTKSSKLALTNSFATGLAAYVNRLSGAGQTTHGAKAHQCSCSTFKQSGCFETFRMPDANPLIDTKKGRQCFMQPRCVLSCEHRMHWSEAGQKDTTLWMAHPGWQQVTVLLGHVGEDSACSAGWPIVLIAQHVVEGLVPAIVCTTADLQICNRNSSSFQIGPSHHLNRDEFEPPIRQNRTGFAGCRLQDTVCLSAKLARRHVPTF